jgi:PAS domain S-box-containing protein
VPIFLAGLLICFSVFLGFDLINLKYILRIFIFMVIGIIASTFSERIAHTKSELLESEERYRLISENANDLIIILNQKFEIEYVNEQTYWNVLSYKSDNILGKTLLFFIHPDNVRIANNVLHEVLKNSEGKVEIRFRNKQGHYDWFELKIKTFFNCVKEKKVLIIARSIKERKEAEKMIQKEIEKLIELDQIKSDFIDRASHELKTPLTAIYAASTFLYDQYKDYFDDKVKDLIKIIINGGERLKILIEDLLDVSRIESNKLKIKISKENMVKILNECVSEMNYFIKERNLKIYLDVDGDFYLNVDRIRIKQVITNLLSNAIKNTLPKGNISINLQQIDGYVEIKINDTGVGFTQYEKRMIFKKFGKIERYGKGMNVNTEGSGLGLYLSKEIVNLHRGKIWVESEGRNKGSSLIIRLPTNI